MKRFIALLMACAAAVPAHAGTGQAIEAEGVAPLGGDAAASRRAAIGEALRQALAAGGMDLTAQTFVDRNVVTSDSLRAKAAGRITGYRLVDVWQDDAMVHATVAATIAPLNAPVCSNNAMPRLHLGAVSLDIDPAVDAVIAAPLRADFWRAMQKAFGASPLDPLAPAEAVPVALTGRPADHYASLAYGSASGTGLYLRPYLKLSGRRTSGMGGAQGQRLEVFAAVEIVDAARGVVIGRVTRTARHTISSRLWDYLPADYRPDRRMAPVDARDLFADLAGDAEKFIRCRPVAVAINGVNGGDLLLGGGADAGLQVGDLLSVGEPAAATSDGLNWPMAEVTEVNRSSARARMLGDDGQARNANVAVRLR